MGSNGNFSQSTGSMLRGLRNWKKKSGKTTNYKYKYPYIRFTQAIKQEGDKLKNRMNLKNMVDSIRTELLEFVPNDMRVVATQAMSFEVSPLTLTIRASNLFTALLMIGKYEDKPVVIDTYVAQAFKKAISKPKDHVDVYIFNDTTKVMMRVGDQLKPDFIYLDENDNRREI